MIRLFDKDMNEVMQDDYDFSLFPLDNFSMYKLTMYDKEFKTGEHAFQYTKFMGVNNEIANKILNAKTPEEAREIAIEHKSERIPNWSEIKYDCMKAIFRLKAEQNPIVLNALLSTKDNIIIEHCVDEDTDWGVDNNLQGENNLGRLWMEVREEYKKTKGLRRWVK